MTSTIILEKGEIQIHPEGTKTHEFTFQLPDEIPSSFEGSDGHVKYTAIATMVCPRWFNEHAQSTFTVISDLDLNQVNNKRKVCIHTNPYLC